MWGICAGTESGEEEGNGSEGGDRVAEEDAGDGKRIALDDEVATGKEKAGCTSDEEGGAMECGKAPVSALWRSSRI